MWVWSTKSAILVWHLLLRHALCNWELEDAAISMPLFLPHQHSQLVDVRKNKIRKGLVEIVIAQRGEDVSWSDDYEHIRTIYCQGKTPGRRCIRLVDIGREAHSYLHHIVANYHQLAEWTVFSTGANPSSSCLANCSSQEYRSQNLSFHSYIWGEHGLHLQEGKESYFVFSKRLNITSLEYSIIGGEEQNASGRPHNEIPTTCLQCPCKSLGCTWRKPSDQSALRRHVVEKCGLLHSREVGDAFSSFWRQNLGSKALQVDEVYGVYAARFAVSRARIWQRPRTFYSNLLHQLQERSQSCSLLFIRWLWYYLVGDPQALPNNTNTLTSPTTDRTCVGCDPGIKQAVREAPSHDSRHVESLPLGRAKFQARLQIGKHAVANEIELPVLQGEPRQVLKQSHRTMGNYIVFPTLPTKTRTINTSVKPTATAAAEAPAAAAESSAAAMKELQKQKHQQKQQKKQPQCEQQDGTPRSEIALELRLSTPHLFLHCIATE